jgi:DNA-binding XRE family transcriptional regulator
VTSTPPRGGATGRSFAPKRTIYKGDKAPKMWVEFMADCKKYREAHGMTGRDVALVMGVSPAVVSLMERGISQPHPWDLTVYLEAIGITKITVE